MSLLFKDAECFRVVYADPPWGYENFGQKKHGAVRAHYETMNLAELAAIPVRKWAADDAFLVLWATWPKLDEALELITAWGFHYVTGFPWVKTVASSEEIRCGIGFWTQSASELVLVARAGSLARLAEPPRVRGLLVGDETQFYAPIGEHSKKPLEIHEWIEQTLPGPRVELFARREHSGWATWGLELGRELGAHGVRDLTVTWPTDDTLLVPGVRCPECEGPLSIEVGEIDECEDGVYRISEACRVLCERDEDAIADGLIDPLSVDPDDRVEHANTQDVWQPVIDKALAWARKFVRVVQREESAA